MIRFILLCLLLVTIAEPAAAGPAVGAAFAKLFVGIQATLAAGGVGAFLLRTAISVGLSLLSQALMKPKSPAASGVKIDGTTAGEDTPMRFVVGRRMVGGHLEYHNSHGQAGRTPNAYYTLVVSVCDVPGATLRRVRVNDEFVTLGGTAHPDYGFPMLEKRVGSDDHGWVKFYDGTQVTADPMLVSRYGADPDQPWTANHILTGVAYAIITLRFNREVWQGPPSLRFEMNGIPLYDPRLDSSVGGSGAHRWNNPATWAPTENLAVIAYNLMRGIPIPGGNIYGGEVEAEDLPLANAVAGMNVCDTTVSGRAQYRGGLEISVDEEPAIYIEELLKAGLGQVSELGGVFRTRWGAPDEAVMAITDEDISVSNPQEFDPFPGIEATYNAIRITHPNVETAWEPAQTPALYNAVWEAEDGDRRLPIQMEVAACFDHAQAQQLQSAYIRDERRFRQHQIVLPPEAQILEPLDTIAWTSERNGYSNKLFEVVASRYMPKTMMVALTLRERDPADYDWDSELELPSAPGYVPTERDPRSVDGADWSVTGTSVTDASGGARRPALLIQWDPEVIEDARQLEYQVEVNATGAPVTSGLANGNSVAVVVVEGVLPATVYRARVRPVVDAPAIWSDWQTATTPDVRLTADDIEASIIAQIDEAEAEAIAAGIDAANALEAALAVEDSAATALVLRPIGGTGAANIRIVEWDDETGVGSAIVLFGDNIIAPGTLSASRLVVTDLSGNLWVNGDFAWGDLRGWATPPNNWAAVARDAASGTPAIANMPTAYAVQTDTDPLADQFFDQAEAFACRAGDRFSISYDYAGAGGSIDLDMGAQILWFDEDGAVVSTSDVAVTDYASTAWASRAPGAVVAPSGAVFGLARLYILGGSTGTGFIANLKLDRQRAGSVLITPNSITGAQLITTEAIITANAQLGTAVIASANIGNLQVQSANIADLTVGTQKITDGATTANAAASGNVAYGSSFTNIAGVGLTCLGSRNLAVTVSGQITQPSNISVRARFVRSGVVIAEWTLGAPLGTGGEVSGFAPFTFSRTFVVASIAGYQDVFLQVRNDSGALGTCNGGIIGVEYKK